MRTALELLNAYHAPVANARTRRLFAAKIPVEEIKMIDFTNSKRIICKAYSGANGKKIAIEYEGEQLKKR